MTSPLPISIDGDALLITVLTVGGDGLQTLSAEEDFYSTWKVWAAEPGNLKYPPAFSESVGGNPTGNNQFVSPYYFLRNDLGWRIRLPEEDGEVSVFGNLFAADTTKRITVPTLGAYTQALRLVISPQSVVTQSGVSGLTPSESVWLERAAKTMTNRMETDPIAGTLTIYDDDDSTIFLQGDLFEDVAATQPYRGRGADRRNRLT